MTVVLVEVSLMSCNVVCESLLAEITLVMSSGLPGHWSRMPQIHDGKLVVLQTRSSLTDVDFSAGSSTTTADLFMDRLVQTVWTHN